MDTKTGLDIERFVDQLNRSSREEALLPELPEVETIRNQIVDLLAPDGLLDLDLNDWDIEVDFTISPVSQRYVGVRTGLVRIQRKGKNLVFYGSRFAVHVHLRMSGQVRIMRTLDGTGTDIANAFSHTKMILAFRYHKDGSNNEQGKSFRLVFVDSRGFGVYTAMPISDSLVDLPKIQELGIDPTYKKEWTSPKLITAVTRFPNMFIGSVLIRQDLIAGIGNIYRSEILHAAGINPMRPAGSLSILEIENIMDCTTDILRSAISLGGCSMLNHRSTYRDLHNRKGRYAEKLAVYQRDGLDCYNCGAMIVTYDIEKLRRIYYCPNCQV